MSVIAWIVVGLVAGVIASRLVNRTGDGRYIDIALGAVGAVIAAWILQSLRFAGVNGLDLYSLIVAALGAVVFVLFHHIVIRRAQSVLEWVRD